MTAYKRRGLTISLKLSGAEANILQCALDAYRESCWKDILELPQHDRTEEQWDTVHENLWCIAVTDVLYPVLEKAQARDLKARKKP